MKWWRHRESNPDWAVNEHVGWAIGVFKKRAADTLHGLVIEGPSKLSGLNGRSCRWVRPGLLVFGAAESGQPPVVKESEVEAFIHALPGVHPARLVARDVGEIAELSIRHGRLQKVGTEADRTLP